MAKTAEVYKLMAGALDQMPAERAVLGLFCDLTLAAGVAPASGTSAAGRDGRALPGRSGLSREGSAFHPKDPRGPAVTIPASTSVLPTCVTFVLRLPQWQT